MKTQAKNERRRHTVQENVDEQNDRRLDITVATATATVSSTMSAKPPPLNLSFLNRDLRLPNTGVAWCCHGPAFRCCRMEGFFAPESSISPGEGATPSAEVKLYFRSMPRTNQCQCEAWSSLGAHEILKCYRLSKRNTRLLRAGEVNAENRCDNGRRPGRELTSAIVTIHHWGPKRWC